MTIKKRLIFGLGIPIFLILAISIVFAFITRRTLQEEMGEKTLNIVKETIAGIDKGIYIRVEEM